MPFRILGPLFHRTHLLFLGSTFLNDVTLRCNPYIMCITRSNGCFGFMHTVIWFYPINNSYSDVALFTGLEQSLVSAGMK